MLLSFVKFTVINPGSSHRNFRYTDRWQNNKNEFDASDKTQGIYIKRLLFNEDVQFESVKYINQRRRVGSVIDKYIDRLTRGGGGASKKYGQRLGLSKRYERENAWRARTVRKY